MPYANNAGVRIHYEVDGTGPALVLHHGFTQCLEDWSECGYVAALRPRYQVILVDARGHGDSDKPHDEASYTLDRRTADVTTVLDALGLEKAHFWGYSMGGRIGFGMARYAPDRVDKLVIASNTPFASDMAGALSSERIPNARFFSLPGLSHLQAFAESSRVLPQVMEFLGYNSGNAV